MSVDPSLDASPSRDLGPAVADPPGPAPALMADSDVGTPPAVDSSASGFGTLLEPVLRAACQDRLSHVQWFRTDWQRGGALTGYATYDADDGAAHRVVVKLPVPPCERQWLVQLQPFDHVVPRVYAHGESLNGYDLAWVVMERLSHGPLSASWSGSEFDLLVEAVGRFYAASQHFPRSGEPTQTDWQGLLGRARQRAGAGSLPDAQRWSACLKRVAKRLRQWTDVWEGRDIGDWCHGDLHLGNAMTRTPAPQGPAVLFDFAKTRVGHWLQDAVYFESQFWARPERLDGRRLCRQIARERKKLGLTVESDWPRLAEAKRVLLAMTVPATLHRDGDPRHVRASLEILERAVA